MTQNWIDAIIFMSFFIGGLMLTLLQETIIERVQKRRAERATSDAIQ